MQLSEGIENLLHSIEEEVYSVTESLRAHISSHTMLKKECKSCGRAYSAKAHSCNRCHTYSLQTKICTSDYRVSQYFLHLQKTLTWPSSKPFRTLSASEITSSITLLQTHLQPDCATGEICPLKKEVEKLVRTAHALLEQKTGLLLSDIKTSRDQAME